MTDQTLAIYESGSVAVGYRCLSAVASVDVEIIEASIVGGARFMTILRGSRAAIEQAVAAAQRASIGAAGGDAPSWESEIASANPAGFLDAYFSLASEKLHQTLIVCETSSMSAQLSAAAILAGTPTVTTIEIKSLRGAQAGAIGYYTGPSADCGLAAESARARLKADGRIARIEVIDDPPPRFRAFFNLSGEI